MEMELLTADEAEKKPAGRGRDEANANPYLPLPTRYGDSLLWYQHPWVMLKQLTRLYRGRCCCAVLLLILGVMAFAAIYALPVRRQACHSKSCCTARSMQQRQSF